MEDEAKWLEYYFISALLRQARRGHDQPRITGEYADGGGLIYLRGRRSSPTGRRANRSSDSVVSPNS